MLQYILGLIVYHRAKRNPSPSPSDLYNHLYISRQKINVVEEERPTNDQKT